LATFLLWLLLPTLATLLSALPVLRVTPSGLTALLALLSTLPVLLHIVCHENIPPKQSTPLSVPADFLELLKVSCGKTLEGWDEAAAATLSSCIYRVSSGS
jgi:hypothetical protein